MSVIPPRGAPAAPAGNLLSLAVPVILAFVALGSLGRIGLIAFNADGSLFQPLKLGPALLIGFGYDLAVALWWALPMLLLAWAWPARRGREALGWASVLLTAALMGLLVFVGVAEFVFWDEFASRFNFIAVDYLLYTREVIGNIRESYSLAPLFTGIGVVALLLTWLLAGPTRRLARRPAAGFLARSAQLALYIGVAAAATAGVGTGWKESLAQPQLVQIAGNGVWEFFHAFRYNQIDYQRFYATLPRAQAEKLLQTEFTLATNARMMATADMPIRRQIVPDRPRRDMNVVLVSIESFGAEFIESLGGKPGLAPNFERLGREGLMFTQMYATGTRTVRGLEALTLSVPPTPGHAIPMRPHHTGLFTLGGVLREQGYDALYLYGGYSYFDNMTSFFGGNGYTVIDRTALAKQDITHENIWGVADEDLFGQTLREIDARTAAGHKVFSHVMTTSNHRPFTYPAGRIDVPSGSGRDGAVKYTDWAIGRFVEQARTRPWFKNTVFVFIADHTSIARGRSDLPLERYHIPMVMYAPGLLASRRIDTRASQIDVAPTLLGWLNIPYVSEFFGQDVLRNDADPHLFMANYQTVGFVDAGAQIELRPKRATRIMPSGGAPADGPVAQQSLAEAIAFYQVAARRFGEEVQSAAPAAPQ